VYSTAPSTFTSRHLTSFICVVLGVSKELQVRPLLLRHMVLLLSGLSLLFVRWRVMASSAPTFQRVDNPASFADSFLTRVIKWNEIIPCHSVITFVAFCYSIVADSHKEWTATEYANKQTNKQICVFCVNCLFLMFPRSVLNIAYTFCIYLLVNVVYPLLPWLFLRFLLF
jgi:hypothetical protein